MGDLILNPLEIQNFRGFQHLTIDHLGRVNLIVGKNNVGKSSLLEAVRLYAQRGSPDLIWEILGSRDESKVSAPLQNKEIERQLLALRYLFYGRKDVRNLHNPMSIGPFPSSNETVAIRVGWLRPLFENDTTDLPLETRMRNLMDYDPLQVLTPRLAVRFGGHQVHYPLAGQGITVGKQIKEIYIGPNGLERSELGVLWDNISLTGLDDEVIAALQIIAPGVERLNFRDDNSESGVRERIAIVKIDGIDEPFPLRSLGDGMTHMLSIALALANAKDGIVLIDEIENGIHYSVQQELWQIVFRLAERLNVQVFATTHSWDCIEGFQQAAYENTQSEGMLIRLLLKGDDVITTLFDERKLAIATREQIEVR